MGNKKSSFSVDFESSCKYYRDLINYVLNKKILHTDSPFLRGLVQQYLINYDHDESFELEISEMGWLHAVHKLHPVKYRKRMLTNNFESIEWLTKASLRQIEFCKKIESHLKYFNLDVWKYRYKKLLKLCKSYPNKIIVPDITEDFMWHAHMLKHDFYYVDCMKKVGYLLDHDDDIDPKMLSKYAREREFMEDRVNYEEKDSENPSDCVKRAVNKEYRSYD
jgi:hypothetical protein